MQEVFDTYFEIKVQKWKNSNNPEKTKNTKPF